jgi:hypothetical protein
MLQSLAHIKVVVPDHVVSRVVDGMTVLLDINSGRTFSLDEVGTRAWLALTESPTPQAAVDVLLGEFTAEPAAVDRDLRAMLDTLAASNLVHIEPR